MHMSRRRLVVMICLALVAAALATAGVVAAKRLTAPLPSATVTVSVDPVLLAAPGQPPVIPVPASGSLVVATDADGVLAASQADVVRPIGSVAKTMTALVVLQQHPLAAGEGGPVLTLTAADVRLYQQAVAEQGSTIPVKDGEQLNERQLLLALMLPSANNIAETLARWVAGSRDAFIALLNQQAAALQMSRTHFADPSGYSPATVSSAGDLVLLAGAALGVPALMEVVSTRTATLPDGLILRNLDALLATEPGWIGVKTGWTPQAGGCLLFAARQGAAPASVPVTLVGAVLGQPPEPAVSPNHPELGGAFHAARAATSAALAGYAEVPLASLHPRITGSVSVPWATGPRLAAGSAVATNTLMFIREGTTLRVSVSAGGLAAPAPSGAVVGSAVASLGDRPLLHWPVVLDGQLATPPWSWRLLNG
jgi:D-alanyl-D-alanine carboxypeptidase (penicillin-binding protein 5/6)